MNKLSIEKLSELMTLRNEKHFGWIKHLLLMASGLLGILVSLHSSKSATIEAHNYFCITIASLGLGILTGSVFLYAEVNTLTRLQEAYKMRLLEDGASNNSTLVTAYKIFSFFEYVCYLSFAISILFLILFAIVSDKL